MNGSGGVLRLGAGTLRFSRRRDAPHADEHRAVPGLSESVDGPAAENLEAGARYGDCRKGKCGEDAKEEHELLLDIPLLGLLRDELVVFLLRLFRGVDEGFGDFAELNAFELRQQTVAQHLARDSGAIWDEERGALHGAG